MRFLGVLLLLTAHFSAELILPRLRDLLRSYVDQFNAYDEELYDNDIPNAKAFDFLVTRIPFFECPDKTIEEIYYFRLWTFRKHIKTITLRRTRTSPRRILTVITEFLPSVPWAGTGNTISAAAGHHYREGRWFAGNEGILDDYTNFWLLSDGGNPRRYSFWIASSLWSRALVTGNFSLVKSRLPQLIQNYKYWEKLRFDAKVGLFWQIDDLDGKLSFSFSSLVSSLTLYFSQ